MRNLKIALVLAGISLVACDTLKKSSDLVLNRFRIASPSMSPNLNVGEIYSVVTVDTLRHNQYVAFHPLKKLRLDNPELIYVSRLVGTPGDTLEMKKGSLLLFGKPFPFDINLKHSFRVETSMPLNETKLEGMDYHATIYNEYLFFATPQDIELLRKNKAVTKITPLIDHNLLDTITFPVPFSGVSVDTWGPIRVPRKNDVIFITSENKAGLEVLITEHENGVVPEIGQPYTVTKNYYFVISDNRHNALDSRFIGFIPEDQIEGIMLKSF